MRTKGENADALLLHARQLGVVMTASFPTPKKCPGASQGPAQTPRGGDSKHPQSRNFGTPFVLGQNKKISKFQILDNLSFAA